MKHPQARRTTASTGAFIAALLVSSAVQASDGTPDTGNQFPAAGAYYEYFVYLTPGELPDVAYAEQSCSGSLIAPKVFMTAAHCTAYNYINDIGITGYYDQAWVTFDLVATGNDFRCFVADEGVPYTEFMRDDYGCDPARKSVPFPTFHPVAIAGRTNGVPIAHGLTHPGYVRDGLRHDGRASAVNNNLLQQPDVGVLILEQPIVGVDPLPLRAVGELDTIANIIRHTGRECRLRQQLDQALRHQADRRDRTNDHLGGGNEVKRIARVGPIKNLFSNSLVPRQAIKKGDDVVCFGDSGSSLFLERNGCAVRRARCRRRPRLLRRLRPQLQVRVFGYLSVDDLGVGEGLRVVARAASATGSWTDSSASAWPASHPRRRRRKASAIPERETVRRHRLLLAHRIRRGLAVPMESVDSSTATTSAARPPPPVRPRLPRRPYCAGRPPVRGGLGGRAAQRLADLLGVTVTSTSAVSVGRRWYR